MSRPMTEPSKRLRLLSTARTMFPTIAVATDADDLTGSLTEDAATLKATGSLTITDTDTGEDKFDTAKDYTGTYGALTITADGDWEYTLDNTGSAVQGLKQDEVVTDVITVYALDGSATEDITITITGMNDAPTITSSESEEVGTVVEDIALKAMGNLNISDVDDAAQAIYVAQTDKPIVKDGVTYGTFSIDTGGAWTFTLDNANVNVQVLMPSDQIDLTIPVVTGDGTAQNITVTVRARTRHRSLPVI